MSKHNQEDRNFNAKSHQSCDQAHSNRGTCHDAQKGAQGYQAAQSRSQSGSNAPFSKTSFTAKKASPGMNKNEQRNYKDADDKSSRR